jgi:nickel-type superoxide dismutase maturation protease
LARHDPWERHEPLAPHDPLGRLPWRRVRVRGPSMAPTLFDADIVLVRRTTVAEPGDIALVRWPARPGQLSVKRVLSRDDWGWHVLGDNVIGSTDSRELGPAVVLGVIHWRLWPRPGRLPRVTDDYPGSRW